MENLSSPANIAQRLAGYSWMDALRDRRSRRFGLGMKIPGGPLAYQSAFAPAPLSEAEEAALVFAACGITGHATADLCYAPEHGGNIMAGLVGRTIASGDAIQTVSLMVLSDRGVNWIKRPQDFPGSEIDALIALGRRGDFETLYERSRVRVKQGRVSPRMEPLYNLNVNQWSLFAPGTSYFLPINELSFIYINGLLEIFNEHTRAFVLDERAHFRPAGLARFARSKGGHLEDDPAKEHVATIQLVERLVTEFVTVEQGMMLQNLGLMAQALGLGGFPHFANHEFGWFESLGFRMGKMAASRYLGTPRLVALGMKLTGRDAVVPYPIGLEVDGQPLLKSYSPPYYPSMEAAVRAVAEAKFGVSGVFGQNGSLGAWKDSQGVRQRIPAVSEASIAATSAYCEYVWDRYGRFPAYMPPIRTVLGFQTCHLDADFYRRFYRPEVLSETHLADFARTTGNA